MAMPLGSSKKTTRKQEAMEREQEFAKGLGGVAQPSSGAGVQHKGDIKLDNFLLDSKFTEANSALVTASMLAKISAEARQIGKSPGLILTLQTPGITPKDWAVIPLEVFQELLEKVDGLTT